jgi:dipeptidyl aminopeptidase/acylaminoacyl peptidase
MCTMGPRLRMLVVLALGSLAAFAPSAQATFPGRNGEIFYRVGWQSRFGGPPSSLEAVNPRTRVIRKLAACDVPGCRWEDLGVSPDGRRLALVEVVLAPSAAQVQVLLMDTDGRVQSRIPFPHDYTTTRPRWSRDQSELVLRSSVSGVPQLSLLGLDGEDHGMAVQGDTSTPNLSTGWGYSFDWSSKGVLAFLGTVPGGCFTQCRSELFVARPGEAPRRITHRGAGSQLSWSPNGRWIAFARQTPGGDYFYGGDIFIVRADGSQVRRVTRRTGFAPSWSPDGKRIAFLRRGVLYTVTPRGTHLRKVKRIAEDLEDPYTEGREVHSIDWQAGPVVVP